MSFSSASNVVEKLLSSQEFYDCTFLVGKNCDTKNTKQFRALRAHLGHISPVFKDMLYGKDSKYASISRDEPIELPNISEVFLKSNELENKFRACIECGTHINKSFLLFCDFIFI